MTRLFLIPVLLLIPAMHRDIAPAKHTNPAPSYNCPGDWGYKRFSTARIPIPQSYARDVITDRKGNLWIGSWTGLYRFSASRTSGLCSNGKCNHDMNNDTHVMDHNIDLSKHFTDLSVPGAENFHVLCLLEDRSANFANDVIWFGTRHHGLGRYDGIKTAYFTVKDGLSSDFIRDLSQDENGNIWIATSNGLNRFDGKTFTKYTSGNGLAGNDIHAAFADEWIGTENGVSRKVSQHGGMISFKTFSNTDGKSFKNVNSILKDDKGNFWFGGPDELIKYDGSKISAFTTADGLPSNSGDVLLQDGNGNLWFSVYDRHGSGTGLSRYDGKRIINFTKSDGLAGNRIFAACQDQNGVIWFATDNGLTLYDGIKFRPLSRSIEGC